jgi:DNA polymerase III delta prime subunit
MNHHAFVIEAPAEEGVKVALAWVKRELGMEARGNPDITVLEYGLFSVEDARRVSELAAGAPFAGEHKVVIIAASRAYHEAQNALLKVFEEPPEGAFLFLILPSLGGLLPTLRSRVQVLDTRCPTGVKDVGHRVSYIPGIAGEFLKAGKEGRSAIVKRLTSGKDDEKKRELRDEAIALINGIEAAAYDVRLTKPHITALLEDIATFREYLYDRSAPVKMILEHLSLVTPKDLV